MCKFDFYFKTLSIMKIKANPKPMETCLKIKSF